ncbi:MAG: HAMP domain-containing protein [Deltaproteobacteria bacterium]|nr:HAMP domain-containing protein [Deltaproteobacteria bacterium]
MARITSLRWKILTGYGIALGLVGVISVWAFATLRDLGEASDAILRENYKSVLAAERMLEAIERQDSAVLLVLLGYEPEGARQFSENEGPFFQSLGRAKDNITISGERAILEAIDRGYALYLVRVGELRLAYRSDPRHARDFYHQTVLPAFKAVRNGCGQLRDLNEAAMVQASNRARKISATARWSGAFTSLAAVGFGLAFSLFLSSRLTRPLRQMTSAAKRLAGGDYHVEIDVSSRDELGLLASEFNGMAQKLKAFRDLDLDRIMAEKVRSEAIVRSIDDGLLVVDSALRVTALNPKAAEIFGVAPERAAERHFLEVVRDDRLYELVKDAVENAASPALEEGRDVFTVGRGSARQHYHFSILPIASPGGQRLGVVLVLRDVTRLKELERLKSEFVMTASHELRTPLTSIAMAIDLLLEEAGDAPRDQELLSAAHEEVGRLRALVDDLLDLARIEAGKIELEFAPTSLGEICERALAPTAAQAAERGVELGMALPEGLPDVMADGAKISFVLVNLIANALRHVDPGGHVRISAGAVDGRVHVAVEDDGTGIPYEYQSKIFDKFVKVKSPRDAGGSGLGLSICREIVRAHGGSIWVDSTPGRGSKFTFTLPAV